jgi:hypothetical protein
MDAVPRECDMPYLRSAIFKSVQQVGIVFFAVNPLVSGNKGFLSGSCVMANIKTSETLDYSEAETVRRREGSLKKMLATPPAPFTPKVKKKPSPAKRKAKKAAR